MNKKTFIENYLNFIKRTLLVYGEEVTTYNFDKNDNLINPKIQKIQKQIDNLERQKKELENQIKLLTNNQ